MKKEKRNNDLIVDPIEGLIIKLSLPIILTSFLQLTYQLTDAFWVGRLGQKTIAAVSLSYPVIFLLISLSIGFSMAGSILIAQLNGKKDYDKLSWAFNQSIFLALILGFLMMGIGLLSGKLIVKFLTQDREIFNLALSYLNFSFWAIPAIFIFNTIQASLRSIGEVKIPFLIIFLSVILNFFLDPVLMFGNNWIPNLGVGGVALATLITESLSAFLIFVLVIKKNYFGLEINGKKIIPQRHWILKIFKLGIPSTLESTSRSLGMTLMTFLVASLGTTVIAGFGIVMRLFSFIIIPSVGFAGAVSVLTGNNLGARRFQRVREITKKGMKISFLVLSFFSLIAFWKAETWVRIFAPHEKEVIELGKEFLRILSFNFGIIGIQMILLGVLRAAGKTTLVMFLAFLQIFLLIFFAFLLAFILGFDKKGIWFSYLFANSISVLVNSLFYFNSKFDKNSEFIGIERNKET